MNTKFTKQERDDMRERMTYSTPTHGTEDYINYNSREYYGTNANGTKYRR